MRGGCEFRELQEFAKKIERMGQQENIDRLYMECAGELAQRLLRELRLNSPVKTGELRRNWQVKDIVKNGNTYSITVENPTPYASYVNYGHRQTPGRYVKAIGKRLKVSWVEGQFFLEISEAELERAMPAFINRKLNAYVRECLNDD